MMPAKACLRVVSSAVDSVVISLRMRLAVLALRRAAAALTFLMAEVSVPIG